MLTMGKESSDRRGLGYELENPKTKNNTSTFIKGKGKAITPSTPNPTPFRVFLKVKVTYAQKGKSVQKDSNSNQVTYFNAYSSTSKENNEKAAPKSQYIQHLTQKFQEKI